MEKWRSLLAQIKFTGAEHPTFTDAEIEAFEQQTGIILPQDYKDFCKVFGSGRFSDAYSIYSLDYDFSEECVDDLVFHWISHKEHCQKMIREYDIKDIDDPIYTDQLIALLKRAFIFGAGLGLFFLWDLSTYNIWIVHLNFTDHYNLGTDFFKFIKDFCLGINHPDYKFIPECLRPWHSIEPDSYDNYEVEFLRHPR
jgi:hypothetical protein